MFSNIAVHSNEYEFISPANGVRPQFNGQTILNNPKIRPTSFTLSAVTRPQQSHDEDEGEKKDEEEEKKPDPLTQLITTLSRGATKEQQRSQPDDQLYMSYAEIMSQVRSMLSYPTLIS